MQSIRCRLILLAIVFFPLLSPAGDYRTLQSETSELRDRYSNSQMDAKTYWELLREKVEALGFADANIHLLKQDLADARKQEPPDLAPFFTRVDALASQEKVRLPPAEKDHNRMERILRRSEFVLEEKPRIWEVLLLRLMKFLTDLLSNIPVGEPLILLSRIITAICLIGLVALLAYLIWRYTRPFPRPASLPALEIRSQEIFLREPSYYVRLAEQALQKREFRPAARHYFYAILAILHHTSIIRYEPSRTNWEYWRMFRGKQRSEEEVQRLQQSILAYEKLWYGNEPVNLDAASAFREATGFFLKRFP